MTLLFIFGVFSGIILVATVWSILYLQNKRDEQKIELTPIPVKEQPRRRYIPKDKREEFHKLLQEELTNRSIISKWNLWIFVEGIYPEIGEGYWHVTEDGTHALHPYVEEKINE